MEHFRQEGLLQEAREALHRQLLSRGRALEQVYTQEVRVEGVGRMNNSKRHYPNTTLL
jgi:hypothetical protein